MILITGVNGFVGSHLAEACYKIGKKISGIGYGKLDEASKLAGLLVKYQSVDMTNKEAVESTLKLDGVESVFHLASLAAVGPSFEQPSKYVADNTAMLINLAEMALRQKCKARIIVVSSGAIYDPNQSMPINETGKLLPNSPYAVSKIATELMCDYYRGRGLDIVVVRPFNHVGPGQMLGFILPDLVKQAQEYNKTGKFVVGNLKTKRDYTDVRDVVKAYIALSNTKNLKHFIYNICSGKSYSGEEILSLVCKNLGINNPKTEIDPAKTRPNDTMDVRGDGSRVNTDTGWAPRVPIAQSVKDFLDS